MSCCVRAVLVLQGCAGGLRSVFERIRCIGIVIRSMLVAAPVLLREAVLCTGHTCNKSCRQLLLTAGCIASYYCTAI